MKNFLEPITLVWKGDEYTLSEENGMMKALAVMQDLLPPQALFNAMSDDGKGLNMAKLSEVYAIALNQAGADVKSSEVYREIYQDKGIAAGVIEMYLPFKQEEETPKKKPVKKKTKSSSGTKR